MVGAGKVIGNNDLTRFYRQTRGKGFGGVWRLSVRCPDGEDGGHTVRLARPPTLVSIVICYPMLLTSSVKSLLCPEAVGEQDFDIASLALLTEFPSDVQRAYGKRQATAAKTMTSAFRKGVVQLKNEDFSFACNEIESMIGSTVGGLEV